MPLCDAGVEDADTMFLQVRGCGCPGSAQLVQSQLPPHRFHSDEIVEMVICKRSGHHSQDRHCYHFDGGHPVGFSQSSIKDGEDLKMLTILITMMKNEKDNDNNGKASIRTSARERRKYYSLMPM